MARACQNRNLRDAESWSSVEVEEESTLIPAAAADGRRQGWTSDSASLMILGIDITFCLLFMGWTPGICPQHRHLRSLISLFI